MTAQLASFEIEDWMPCFLKRPFSWAMTIGEQSVSAMMPKRTVGDSGESSAYTEPIQPEGRPARSDPATVVRRN